MEGMSWASFLTILFTTIVGSGGTVGALKLVADAMATRRTQRAQAIQVEVTTESDRLDVAQKYQAFLDDRAAEAFKVVQDECSDCKARLNLAEIKSAEFEVRMHSAETRMYDAEQRERKMTASMRAVVRVLETGDQAQIDEAVTAVKGLI